MNVKDLKAAADEMNKVMGLDPKIKTVAIKEDALRQLIIDNAIGDDGEGNIDPKNGIQEIDNLSPDTWATLAEILDPENEDHATVLGYAKSHVEANEAKKAEKTGKGASKSKDKGEKPAKAEKGEKTPRKTVPASERKSVNAQLLVALEGLVEKGKSTRKEIIAALKEKFPAANPSTINTMVTDCCNPKYNKLTRLAIKDDKGILSFGKSK